MAFVPSYTTTQTVGYSSQINFLDTSTGTDAAITQRRIYLAKVDSTFLVPTGTSTEYIEWAISSLTKTVDALDKDYCLLVTVQWLDVNGEVLYDVQTLSGFTLYNETFLYSNAQMLAGNPLLVNDNNFWQNSGDLRTYIDNGNSSISLASDQFTAQQCYDEGTKLRVGSKYYFNENS